jgi:hypothetical protein
VLKEDSLLPEDNSKADQLNLPRHSDVFPALAVVHDDAVTVPQDVALQVNLAHQPSPHCPLPVVK